MDDSIVLEGPPPINKLKRENQVGSASSFFESTMNLGRPEPVENKLAYYKSSVFAEEENLPPVTARKCTDVLFLLLFGVYWAGLFCSAMYAYANGDPLLLVYGTDNEGRLCGDGELKKSPFLVWPRFSIDIFEAVTENPSKPKFDLFGVCAESCPKEGQLICSTNAEALIPPLLEANIGLDRETAIRDCIDNPIALIDVSLTSCLSKTIRDECFETLFNTTGLLFRCFPEFVYEVDVLDDESGCTKFQNFTDIFGIQRSKCARFKKVTKVTEEKPTDTDLLFEAYNTAGRYVSLLISDLYKAFPVIGIVGMAVSTILSLLYISLMWCFVAVVVWAAVILCVVVMFAFTVYCYFKAGLISADVLAGALQDTTTFLEDVLGNAGDQLNFNITSFNIDDELVTELPDFIQASSDYSDQFETGAYLMTIFTVLIFLIILFIIPKIVRAIEFFKEASLALRANMDLLILPPISAALLLLNAAFFLFSLMYMLSCGEIKIKALNITLATNQTALQTSEFVSFSYMEVMCIFLLLGFFWTTNLISGMTTLVISNVIAQSYWGGKSGTIIQGYHSGNILKALYVSIRYHIGTVAFGSLLIALVQVVRYVAAFVEQRTKQVKQESRVVKVLFVSIHCFLRCAEKCVEFISKNAYIMTAMYGTSFCKSSKMAFFAIAHNLSQVATVSFLGDVILRFGQIFITVSCGLIAFLILDYDPQYDTGGDNELFSFFFPVAVSMVLAWVISAEVLQVYDVAVETILLSYCQDRKRLDLRGKRHIDGKLEATQIYASMSLQSIIDKNKLSEEEMKKQKTLYMVN